jgi:PKD repeat protein
MKKHNLKLIIASLCLALGSCNLNESPPELKGDASTADFSFTAVALPDTLPYLAMVKFTNLSTGGFAYQWDFNDGSARVTTKNASHTFAASGEYNVALYSVGSNGSSKIVKRVFVPSACDNTDFNAFTDCNKRSWVISSASDAIVIKNSSGGIVSSSAANACQTDDFITYNVNGLFEYNAGADNKTYNGASCVDKLANAVKFKIQTIDGEQTKIMLNASGLADGSFPFLGSAVAVTDNTYSVESLTSSTMLVKGELSNGNTINIKMREKPSGLPIYLEFLTGGSSRSWILDSTATPGPVKAGPTEDNPYGYFGGGALAACQKDDIYTFTATSVTYVANGETFNGGNIVPNFSCSAPLDYADVAYTLTIVSPGLSGVAQINLSSKFIGVTDVDPANVYRILEIDNDHMVLRSGVSKVETPGKPIHELRFIRAD